VFSASETLVFPVFSKQLSGFKMATSFSLMFTDILEERAIFRVEDMTTAVTGRDLRRSGRGCSPGASIKTEQESVDFVATFASLNHEKLVCIFSYCRK
jgi:hypothetical protein